MPQKIAKTRHCMFCGRTPVTKEHVFPRWLANYTRERIQGSSSFNVVLQGPTGGQPRSWQGNIFNTTARIVCKRCNNEWMSVIEEKAAPILKPMIVGNQVALDPAEQQIVATWVALKAVISRHTHSPPLPLIEADWLEWFYKEHTVPQEWQVWITGYSGNAIGLTAYEGHNVHDLRSMTGSLRAGSIKRAIFGPFHGVLATFIIGNLAIKIFGTRRFRFANIFREETFARIAPMQTGSVIWPPQRIVTDDTLGAFFDITIPPRRGIARHLP